MAKINKKSVNKDKESSVKLPETKIDLSKSFKELRELNRKALEYLARKWS